MTSLRETLKRALPPQMREAVIEARRRLAAPPLEEIVLHAYDLRAEPSATPRLSLVIPDVAPAKAFGGVTTGLDIVFEVGKRTGADLRVILDDFGRDVDRSVVDKRARAAGVDPSEVEVVARAREVPTIGVRPSEVFCTFNWWTTLNVRGLIEAQHRAFGGPRTPLIYLVQEYEPGGYPFSSTHMMARLALDSRGPSWGVFNSSELASFVEAQGHKMTRAFVFEPRLSPSLRPFLAGEPPVKARRILVYGRPQVERNCFPAVEKALRLWAERYPEFCAWEVVSAGMPHPPAPIGRGRAMTSLGMLSLEDYAARLRTSAVGLSLMSSPHPSYPPLEMAHFGLRTVTNAYAHKDLALSHPNIISSPDISPETIAAALAQACRDFEADPGRGWRAVSGRPSFLEAGPPSCVDELALALRGEVWAGR
jgi:hypothetical protein